MKYLGWKVKQSNFQNMITAMLIFQVSTLSKNEKKIKFFGIYPDKFIFWLWIQGRTQEGMDPLQKNLNSSESTDEVQTLLVTLMYGHEVISNYSHPLPWKSLDQL